MNCLMRLFRMHGMWPLLSNCFTILPLIHDDIMDKAPLRRGMETVHTKYGESTALLAGDVMLVAAYEYLNKIDVHLTFIQVIHLFNKTAREVCEGQQMDMDFEKERNVSL